MMKGLHEWIIFGLSKDENIFGLWRLKDEDLVLTPIRKTKVWAAMFLDFFPLFLLKIARRERPLFHSMRENV